MGEGYSALKCCSHSSSPSWHYAQYYVQCRRMSGKHIAQGRTGWICCLTCNSVKWACRFMQLPINQEGTHLQSWCLPQALCKVPSPPTLSQHWSRGGRQQINMINKKILLSLLSPLSSSPTSCLLTYYILLFLTHWKWQTDTKHSQYFLWLLISDR